MEYEIDMKEKGGIFFKHESQNKALYHHNLNRIIKISSTLILNVK